MQSLDNRMQHISLSQYPEKNIKNKNKCHHRNNSTDLYKYSELFIVHYLAVKY